MFMEKSRKVMENLMDGLLWSLLGVCVCVCVRGFDSELQLLSRMLTCTWARSQKKSSQTRLGVNSISPHRSTLYRRNPGSTTLKQRERERESEREGGGLM